MGGYKGETNLGYPKEEAHRAQAVRGSPGALFRNLNKEATLVSVLLNQGHMVLGLDSEWLSAPCRGPRAENALDSLGARGFHMGREKKGSSPFLQ